MENKKAVYIRVSTEEQTPENQIREIETISGKDYILFQDKQSAWKDDKERPEFEKLKKEIQSGKFTELYVWDWDRLFRNRKKLKEFFQLCNIFNCQIHSFRQEFYDRLYKIPEPFNEIVQGMLLDFMGWLAEDESTKKSKRVKLAIRREGGITKSYKGNKWGRKSLKIEDEIIKLRNEGKTMEKITEEVFYWDKNNHKKFVSKGYVHKVISGHKLGIKLTSDLHSESESHNSVK